MWTFIEIVQDCVEKAVEYFEVRFIHPPIDVL
jgi:hypothetical protein